MRSISVISLISTDAPLYKPYRYVSPQRVGFFRRFGLKTVEDFAHLSGIGYSFRGSYGGV